ncbi:MAG: gliding motility-associated C-terminal domain-containing protein [Chitinophagaceae bacterium]|nr:gliding motility-associated C-terminal domain-containing protein [Chitinophagaceae bacterium]
MPGFKNSALDSTILYRDWSTASIDLSGYAGKTIIVEFASGDCLLGGHFGYGYIDVSCALYQAEGVHCNDDSLIHFSAPPGFADYKWYDTLFASVLASGQYVNLPNTGGTKKYMVVLLPYPGYGCADTLETTVFYADLNISTLQNMLLCSGDSLHLKASAKGSSDHYSFVWSPAANLSCQYCDQPTMFPTAVQQVFTVTVTDGYGCKAQDTLRVTPSYKACCTEIFVPDAFTPNDDGLNDAFRIRTNLDIDVKDWSVYNRWGKKLWSSTRYYDDWDGTYEQKAQDMGVYFYVITYECMINHKLYTVKGDITLIR